MELKKIIDENNRYKNFAEEVEILLEMKSGSAYSLYSVRNKNDVVFQAVSGRPDLSGKGFLGFINGDRARPTVIGFGVKTDIIKSNAPTFIEPDDSVGINFVANPIKTVVWDIDHGIQNELGFDNIVEPNSVTVQEL